MNNHRTKPEGFYEGILFVTTIAWSLSFVWSKVATNTGMSSEMYIFFRYILAALILLPFAAKQLIHITKKEFISGVLMGTIFFTGMMFQTTGITMTTPSNSSFITTSYVVLAPFTTWLLMKQKPNKKTYAAVVLCLAGIYLLSMKPGEHLALNLGNLLTIAGAVGWAFQLSYTSIAGAYMSPVLLSFMTFAVTGLGGLFAGFVTGSVFTTTMTQISDASGAILLTALVPTICASLMQTYAQHRVDANKAAAIYALEAVFATLISMMIGLEGWSISVVYGGALILSGVLITQVGGKKENA